MIDDHDADRRLLGVQFQIKLLLDGSEQRRRRIGGIAGRRHLDAHPGELRLIRRPLQYEVPFAVKTGRSRTAACIRPVKLAMVALRT